MRMNYVTICFTTTLALAAALFSLLVFPLTGHAVTLPNAPAQFETSLQNRIAATDTSMELVRNSVRGGGTLSGYQCFTIDEGRSDSEYVCGTVTGTTVSSLERGIDLSTGTSSTASLKYAHRRGSSIKVTDFPLIARMRHILAGVYAADYTPNEAGDLTTKSYVDALSFGGLVPIGNESDDGVVELATAQEQASSSVTGNSGSPLVLQAKNATSSYNAATAGNKVVVTQNNGKIDDNFLSTSLARTASTSPNILILYAGETINGGTLPVPVYIDKSDNRVYAASSTNNVASSSMKFVGFATTNATASTTITVQTSGIVSGFSALQEGQKYYVTSKGTISPTVGTNEILVGIALNTNQLLIQKGRRYASGITSFTNNTTKVFEIGFRPSRIRFHAVSALGAEEGQSSGGWTVQGGNNVVYVNDDATSPVSGATGQAYYAVNGGGNGRQGTVQVVTDTSFDLESGTLGSGGTVYIFWEAEGEL